MSKLTLLSLAGLVAAVTAGPLSDTEYQYLFTHFAKDYKKNYTTSELFTRYNTFKSNLDLIIAHNVQDLSWKMGVNQFTDMTREEFSKMMGFVAIDNKAPNSNYVAPTCQNGAGPLNPDTDCKNADCTIDWVAEDQASCGSCWAFSSIAGLESIVEIKTGKKYKLSEQQAVDCSTSNSACSGGLMEKYYDDVMNGKLKYGVCKSEDYAPYSAKKSTCQTEICQGVVGVTGYCRMPISKDNAHDDAWIKQLNQGPITVGVAASSSAFQMYKSGVVTTCTDASHNHAVVVTSYGVDADTGLKYWAIRNSWGSSWGEEGYIRLATAGPSTGKAQCGLTLSGRDIVVTDLA